MRDILMVVSPLAVMLSYIISACDNKQPLVALSASSASQRVCKESGAETRLTRLCVQIGLGLGFKAEPWAVRGSKRTIEGQRSAGWRLGLAWQRMLQMLSHN